jgi:DNA-binding transcriptional MerR regulator
VSVATEERTVRDTFSRVDEIQSVASTLPDADDRRERLLDVMRRELDATSPIRPAIAAQLLGLTEKTVRAWAKEGVLTAAQEQPRLLLEPQRLHAVLRLVRDLRDAGKTSGLLDEVYRRLSDQALLERNDLSESLAQMRRGEGRLVASRPLNE